MEPSKTDIVWAAVVGPTTSMEVAASTGMSQREVSATLGCLFKLGRIERAPYRVSTRNAQGGRCQGAWIYYDNEKRPQPRERAPETARRRREREEREASSDTVQLFNAWVASS